MNLWTEIDICGTPLGELCAFLRTFSVRKRFFSCFLSPFTPLIEIFGVLVNDYRSGVCSLFVYSGETITADVVQVAPQKDIKLDIKSPYEMCFLP